MTTIRTIPSGSQAQGLKGVAISILISALVVGCTTAGASPIPGGSGASIAPSPSAADSATPEASASVEVSPAVAPS